MNVTEQLKKKGLAEHASDDQWPGIDSRFRLIVVAALRTKQLLHGARPRIETDPLRRRNTSIALEETRQGLVPYTSTNVEGPYGDNGVRAKSSR